MGGGGISAVARSHMEQIGDRSVLRRVRCTDPLELCVPRDQIHTQGLQMDLQLNCCWTSLVTLVVRHSGVTLQLTVLAVQQHRNIIG